MHHTPGSIVVGVDGSPHSARALRWAIRQAVAEHRPLTLVHTIHAVTPAFLDAAIVDAQNARTAIDKAGQRVLDDARTEVESRAPDLEVHTFFDLVDPRDLLLQLSDSAAMLVVGSRGRGQLGTLLLGSVSVAVVRHARCPVVVVRPENESTVRSGVLAGVDASPDSLPVLEFAYRQASLHDLRLTILDCTWDIQGGTMGAYLVADEMADLEGERLALAEAMAGMQEKYPDVHVTTRLGSGLPHEALVTSGDQMDLIVVGAHQKSRISHALFGSVSVSVVESATCPVAVVPLSVTD